MDPNNNDIFAGFSGLGLSVNSFDLGEGLVLSKTYAHLMAPMLMAFKPASPGQHHPGPLKTTTGGWGFDINIQLHVPLAFDTSEWFDRVNSVWWIAALLRIIGASSLIVTVLSDISFSEVVESKRDPHLIPMEATKGRIIIEKSSEFIEKDKLKWVKKYWRSGGMLMRLNNKFNLAFQSFDNAAYVSNPDLYFLDLWTGLEALFSPAKTELRFRISSLIATFLEDPGEARHQLQKDVAKLYKARSNFVHGSSKGHEKDLIKTYYLMKRAIIKIIEINEVPSIEWLEKMLFEGKAYRKMD